MKRLFLHSYIKYLVLVALVMIITFLHIMARGSWNMAEIDFKSTINYINGLFIGGFVLLCCGGLSWINYIGGFDFWQYAFSKKQVDGRRVNAYDYSEYKKAKRNKEKLPFGPYLLVGILSIVVSIIIYIV